MMTTFQERFEEVDDGVDPEFVAALEYARTTAGADVDGELYRTTPDWRIATSAVTVTTLATVVRKTVALTNSLAVIPSVSALKAPTRMIGVTAVGPRGVNDDAGDGGVANPTRRAAASATTGATTSLTPLARPTGRRPLPRRRWRAGYPARREHHQDRRVSEQFERLHERRVGRRDDASQRAAS